MKSKTIVAAMYSIAVITVAAVSALIVISCGSSPSAEVPSELQITPAEFLPYADGQGFRNADFSPRSGRITMPDGIAAYFIEHAKTRMQSYGTYEIRLNLDRSINFRRTGYNRMSIEIATENIDILDDIGAFFPRLINRSGEFAQWPRYDDFSAARDRLEDDSMVFTTLEWSFLGEMHSNSSATGLSAMTDVTSIILRLIPRTDEDIPGKIYFRNLRVYRD